MPKDYYWEYRAVETIDEAITALFSMKPPVILLPEKGRTIGAAVVGELRYMYMQFHKVKSLSPTGVVIIKKKRPIK